jgi:hypothetical protein
MSRSSFPLAGFQVTINGRFWVTAEAKGQTQAWPLSECKNHIPFLSFYTPTEAELTSMNVTALTCNPFVPTYPSPSPQLWFAIACWTGRQHRRKLEVRCGLLRSRGVHADNQFDA